MPYIHFKDSVYTWTKNRFGYCTFWVSNELLNMKKQQKYVQRRKKKDKWTGSSDGK